MDDQILLRPGESRTFDVAGVCTRFRVEPAFDASLVLSGCYRDFASTSETTDVDIRVTSRPTLDNLGSSPAYDSGHHWRVHDHADGTLFEFLHPPTERVYGHVLATKDFSEAEIAFSVEAWRQIAKDDHRPEIVRELPHPVDQLLLVPRLASTGACVFHAAGVAIDGKAHVFAGHSGDGKTTLSRLLQREGVELLSDERIVIRSAGDVVTAHGTPWPGEGKILSKASYPLESLCLIHKSDEHRIEQRVSHDGVAELLTRAIVPYYLPDVAGRIFAAFSTLAERIPLRELYFARRQGLLDLLRGEGRPSSAAAICAARA